MGYLKLIVLSALVVLFGIYLKSDSDLFLRFLPNYPADGFNGQIIWITGASSGIGAALAETLTKAGAQVIISARRANQLEEVADRCEKVGKRPYVLQLDVTNLEAQTAAFTEIKEKFGHIDSLVLNAGRSQRASAMDTPIQDTRDLFELNFFSFVNMAKIVAPDMIERKQGQIVVVSSLAGKMGVAASSSYSATKFALHGYFDALRAEIAQHNISISIVCPGPVESEISRHVVRGSLEPVKDHDEKRMTGERCAYLTAKGMYHKVAEYVISEQPFTLLVDLITQFPLIMRPINTKIVGPNRLKMMKDGMMYNVQDNFRIPS